MRNAQTIDGLSAFVVEYRSGDVWSPRIKAPGKSKWAPITLKRGITSDNSLFEWRQKVIEGKIDEARSTCTIDAQTPGGSSYEIVLLSCWPSSYQGPQRTTTAFQGPESVTIQFDSAEVRR